MKKLILILFVPLFVFSCLVGVGYGIWYYTGNTSTSTNVNTNVNVSGISNCGIINITNKHNIKIVITQRNVSLTEQIKVQYEHIPANGDIKNIDFTFTLKIPAALNNEIDAHSSYLDLVNVKNITDATGAVVAYEYSGTWDPTEIPNKPNYYEFITDLSFAYKKGHKPTTEQQVLDMLAFKGSSIEITFVATDRTKKN